MTRVGFYVIQNNDVQQRLHIAARLADKAFQQGMSIYINADSEDQARQLDELLWSFRPGSFLPHGITGMEHSEKIAIGWGQEPGNHNDLLINLQLGIPPFFGRFNRVAEVVTQDPKSLASLRESWSYYKARGYQLDKHDL
ncbi:MAG: DNA polymerase III subunit chi [Halioglobus sp.]